jgi:hypothetical protein
LVVWNMFYDFPFSWECNNHPNWRTPSFFRGVASSTTNQWILEVFEVPPKRRFLGPSGTASFCRENQRLVLCKVGPPNEIEVGEHISNSQEL